MKKIILILCAFGISINIHAQNTGYKQMPKKPSAEALQQIIALAKSRETKLIGTAIAPLQATELDGSAYTIAKAKTTFIHFWNASNPMSIAQMDGMHRLYQKLKDSTALEFITITYESDSTIASCKKMYNMPYKILKMSKEKCNVIKQETNVPTNMVVDKAGIIRYMKCGGDIDTDMASQFVISKMLPQILAIYNTQ